MDKLPVRFDQILGVNPTRAGARTPDPTPAPRTPARRDPGGALKSKFTT